MTGPERCQSSAARLSACRASAILPPAMEHPDNADAPARFQLHLVLAYKHEPRHDPNVRAWLERGYRVEQLQRLSDREVLITLAR